MYLPAYEAIVLEAHDLSSTEEGLLYKGQDAVFQAFVLVTNDGLAETAAFELVGPVEEANALLHDGGMGVLVYRQLVQVAKIELFLLLAEIFFGAGLTAVDGGKGLALLLHIMGWADPAVVIDMGVDAGYLQLEGAFFLAIMDAVEFGDAAEGLGLLPGVDVLVVPDDADLIGVPGMAGDVMVVVTPEMAVFEEDAFHGRIV